MKTRFPARAGDTADIVFTSPQGVTNGQVRDAMDGLFASLFEVRRREALRVLYEKPEEPFERADNLVAFGAELAAGIEPPKQKVLELAVLPRARRAESDQPPALGAHFGHRADAPGA